MIRSYDYNIHKYYNLWKAITYKEKLFRSIKLISRKWKLYRRLRNNKKFTGVMSSLVSDKMNNIFRTIGLVGIKRDNSVNEKAYFRLKLFKGQ